MSKSDILKNYISNLDGYKISNTHFKIGAKIHSSDFYYAKRLFQNSYYTSRISLKLALRINNELKDKGKKISLVGYEMYSELVLSLIKKFLNDFGYHQVNHCTTKDVYGEITYLPDNIKLNDNIIIIVPITSTGGTSAKIKEHILSSEPDLETNSILSFTVLQAYDSSQQFRSLVTQSAKNALIFLETEWSHPQNCINCFDNTVSKPLFETDKSSLTPTLIFNLPSKGKKPDENPLGQKFEDVIFEDALIYRRAKRNNEHFLFSTDTNILLNKEKNKNNIISWLKKVKTELVIQTTDKVVIISPSHYSNTQFINLVNEEVFHNSATIIHHQTDVDFLDNFKLLNQSFLSREDTKIFFVDDSLISGKSFFKIYELFRYANQYKKRLNGAIFLSNKASTDINKRVSRTVLDESKKDINYLYAFVHVNLPIHPTISNKKPLEHEVIRYKLLFESTLHDAIKKYFIEKSEDIRIKKTIKDKSTSRDKNKSRHLKMFMATHKVYEFFKNRNIQDNFNFNTLLKGCGLEENDIEDKMALMKVLCQFPFLLYKPLRKLTFKWQKEWLDKTVINQKNSIHSKKYTYNDFKELKFLLRRAVFLGNYEILSVNFIDLISQIFIEISSEPISIVNRIRKSTQLKKHGQLEVFPDNNTAKIEYEEKVLNDEQKNNLQSFHVYLTKNYVELFSKNGWCANNFLENLSLKEQEFSTSQGSQFLRMIKIESAAIINSFYKILDKREDWRKLYKMNVPEKTETNKEETVRVKSNPEEPSKNNQLVLDETKIENYIKDNYIESTDDFKLSNSILKLVNDKGNLKPEFISFLWLKQFLITDNNTYDSDDRLNVKTEMIFLKMKALFGTEPGAFFIVKYGKDKNHLVYDRDADHTSFINELHETRDKLLLDFMDGQKVSYPSKKDKLKPEKTIIEYEFTAQTNEWEDRYSLIKNIKVGKFEHQKWLLLIRISDEKFKTLGLVGFYGKETFSDNLLSKQLLMSLRGDLAKFIIKHHKNDAFSALIETEAVKRFAYLAGHGRQMMQALANSDRNNFGSVIKTTEKLQYLFATKQISNTGNAKGIKTELEQEIIRTFSKVKITTDILNKIIIIGNKIYELSYVENKVDLLEELQEIKSFEGDFYFNEDILKFMCFEFFVNAKKNRFHFIGNDCASCQRTENELEIKFSNDVSDKLVIELVGSGPHIPVDVQSKINKGDLVKPNTEISGLHLVDKVMKLFDLENQLQISSDENERCDLCGYGKNKLTATLISTTK